MSATGTAARGPAPARRHTAGGRAAAIEPTVAMAVVAISGMRIQVYHGITAGLVLGMLLSPVWIPEIRRHGRFASWLVGLVVAAQVWGLLLTWNASATHAIDTRQAFSYLAYVAQLVAGAGVIWWARRVLSVRLIAALFACGIVAQGVLTGAEHTANPWKTLIAVPLAIFALALCLGRRRVRLLELVVLGGVAFASAFLDSRSYAASFLLSALLVAWQLPVRTVKKSRSTAWTAAMLAGLAYGAYLLGQNLLVAGYLGANAQARTIAQIQQGGSLIYGGRPELKATLALISDDPWGHGVGVIPSFHDVQVAKTALAGVLYDPNNGYVDTYMFGNDIELHSIFGDLWSHFGIVGIALVALIAYTAVSMVLGRLNERRASGLVLFLGLWTLWNVFFSPFYSALPTLILLFGLLDESPVDSDRDAAQRAAHGSPQQAG